ncbi:YHYH domain-containing protein [Colwellia sp. Arc7-D]|uniref:YHYH domain-containing protein n=1 Tax=Colwellia sp. Arc7-D TaxID=2161872 RepID=UPI000D35EA0B|nr:YHYH domain-containing protein [Colwellia sp. Arc7-D]AWB58196.1 hypothetical protein DBO93_11875 [Colwellia sp. Arc7-D]
MKKILIGLVAIVLLTSQASAHSGRTDKNGGHNCSKKSVEKGLCEGYHYHNGQPFANNAKGHEEHKSAHEHQHEHQPTPIVSTKV